MRRSILTLIAVAAIMAIPAAAGAQETPTPTCNGIPATLWGTTGDDTLIGTVRDDVIVGGDGNDHIQGLGGNDIICGGDGDDEILGRSGDDTINGGPGNDNLNGEYYMYIAQAPLRNVFLTFQLKKLMRAIMIA